MSFLDAFMSRFKKVDDSELNRLRHAPPPSSSPEQTQARADTPLGIRAPRSGASKSVTRLRAFIKQKSPEEIAAEDAARVLANEQYTERSINDMSND
jgi:hypothetical protein